MELTAIFSNDRSDKLEHYGVKGMKWHQHLKKKWSTRDTVTVRDSKGNAGELPAWLVKTANAQVVGAVSKTVSSTISREKNRAKGKKAVNKVLSTVKARKKAVDTAKKNVNTIREDRRYRRMRNTEGGKF